MNFQQIKNKKVGVIGMGYVGRNFIKYLQSLDIDPVIINRNSINILYSEEFDYLINCAGNSGDFRDNILETIESNIGLNSFIIKSARINESYIYLSSSRVYGFVSNPDTIFNEDTIIPHDHLSINYIYDGSKQLAESMLFNISSRLNYKIAILRLSNVYGRFDLLDDTTLIKKIIRYKLHSLDDLSVNINRYSSKDYIHIDDVCETLIRVMVGIEKTNIYNLAYGKSYSLDRISKNLGLNIQTNENIPEIHSLLENIKIKKEFSLEFKYDFLDFLKAKTDKGDFNESD